MSIKKFNQFVSEGWINWKEPRPVFKLELIPPGTQVTYSGLRYYVVDSNEFTMELSREKDALPGDRKNFLVNKNMFSQMGGIYNPNPE
jgi:hypothetical protein